jgi:hypothetical protein
MSLGPACQVLGAWFERWELDSAYCRVSGIVTGGRFQSLAGPKDPLEVLPEVLPEVHRKVLGTAYRQVRHHP